MHGNLVDQLVDLTGSAQAAEDAVKQLNSDELMAVGGDLKKRALFYLRRDGPKALAIADLILNMGLWRDEPRVQALGLQTKAIALTLALRAYDEALTLFEESEAIYRVHDDELSIAIGQISRVWALACLQRYDEAFAVGERSISILARHEDYLSLAALNNNLAAIYGRRGQDLQALDRVREVEAAYQSLGEEGERRLSLALINRAILLRNLGRFAESIAANERSLEIATRYSQTANIAHAQTNLGVTYFLIGRITRAQTLLQLARDTFISDNRYRDAIEVELFFSDGLLHLRRFKEVLAKCRQVIETFEEAGTQFEVAQARLNEATALTGLHAYGEALHSLAKARETFQQEANETWQVYTDLEEVTILFLRHQYEASEALATRCSERLRALKLPLKEGLALVSAARAALANGRLAAAQTHLERAQVIASVIDVPLLNYQASDLKGQIELARGDRGRALAAYDSAIRELERLQGQIMVEFRADFLSDKDEVYAHAVDLCLQAGNPAVALTYAERAKSRALLAMLAHHADLRIEARSTTDQPLVDRIMRLRQKRDRLYRRWQTGEIPGSSLNREVDQQSGQAARDEARQMILQTEDELRELWHDLLVRNAAYARDASLWQVQTSFEQERLGADTLLIEFFALARELVVFLVTSTEVEAVRLPLTMKVINRHHQKLHHNFSTLLQAPHLAESFTRNAKRILQSLYDMLIAPWIDSTRSFSKLVIVPHGPLHYLPFHALFDGREYLLQRYQISYLPGISFLNPAQEALQRPLRSLVMGHTQKGLFANIPDEVDAVAAAFNTRYYMDEEATRSRFQKEAPLCQVIHMAAHGDFQPSNPLFSGLYLEDGLLTTLDVFNLHLRASLVTLSACQTGRHLIAGGDELFGLTRAFLASGAASLILTLWPVEDETTRHLMRNLYANLLSGQDKVAALRGAQSKLIEGESKQVPGAHPYYWAPFFLVGDSGPLLAEAVA